MSDIIIRDAEMSDLETLLRFEQNIVNSERPFDSTLRSGEIHYYPIRDMITDPQVKIIVVVFEGQIIGSGFARIEKALPYVAHLQHAWLGFMYVEPQHRGKGIVGIIIEELRKWAASRNITEMRLDVYHNNLPAFRAYEKAGFERHLVQMRMPV